MSHVLILIALFSDGTSAHGILGTYNNMDECFTAREIVVENIGRPIFNYQAICVQHIKEI